MVKAFIPQIHFLAFEVDVVVDFEKVRGADCGSILGCCLNLGYFFLFGPLSHFSTNFTMGGDAQD